MKILVANLGSTSFKYRLFDMTDERQLARGGVERIGASESPSFVEIDGKRMDSSAEVPDHAAAVRSCLAQLTDPELGCLANAEEVAAIGFKAVHGGRVGGVQRVSEEVLTAMEEMGTVAPAHNPPYVEAMRLLAEKMPEMPLVAAFETGFHQTIPPRQQHYAVPKAWADDFAVRRWGFHGASHRYIATRTAQLLGRDDLRIISCHLGGSSSLCAIRDGQSVATSMGMSPQTGLPQNNRVGDFDPYALPGLMARMDKSLEEVLDMLGNESGLLGLSGVSGDIRDLYEAAKDGNAQAKLAIDVYTTSIRNYLGSYLVELGGADAIVFTGGIGENSVEVRDVVCSGLAELGIVLDNHANNNSVNESANGEAIISGADSRTEVWVVPTNEELVVARQTQCVLTEQ